MSIVSPIASILELAKLPSTMKVEGRIGDATVAVVDSVIRQIESATSNEDSKSLIQQKLEKAKLVREVLGLSHKETITQDHIKQFKQVSSLLDTI